MVSTNEVVVARTEVECKEMRANKAVSEAISEEVLVAVACVVVAVGVAGEIGTK